MQDIIFREYDIRGKIGSEFVIEETYSLAQAIAAYFLQKKPTTKTVAVGMDGRIHSPEIKDAVVRALCDSGLDVVFLGVCPTPVLYFALYTIPVDAGIMITASHNPPDFNGIKLCLGHYSVWGLQVQEIKQLYRAQKKVIVDVKGTVAFQPIIERYIDWLTQHFAHLKGMPLSGVIDCGNGAGGTVIPELIQKMDWHNVQVLYPEVDGTYPNHEADPVKEKNMADVKNVLATTDCSVGIGLDGDVDRMAAMTKEGFLVPGDQLLALFARQMLDERPHASIVMDIKSSAGLLELLEQWQAKAILSPSGHAIIKDQMRKHGAMLGGELSCHFFFHDRYFGYDDGIYAMMRLFEILMQSGKSLTSLLSIFPKKHSSLEYRIACDEKDKSSIVKFVEQKFQERSDVKMITIDGVRAIMPYGWGILRASNTQSELCLRFESDSLEGLQRVKQDFLQLLYPSFERVALDNLIIEGKS